MTLRQYLSIMILGTALCAIAWVVVLFNVDPFLDQGFGRLFFYLSTFFMQMGLSSMIIFGICYAIDHSRIVAFRLVSRSFLLGIITSAIITILLYLQGKQLLHIWNVIIFIAIICFLLLFRLSVNFHKKDVTE